MRCRRVAALTNCCFEINNDVKSSFFFVFFSRQLDAAGACGHRLIENNWYSSCVGPEPVIIRPLNPRFFFIYLLVAKVRNCGSCTPIHVFPLNKGTVCAAFLNPAHTWWHPVRMLHSVYTGKMKHLSLGDVWWHTTMRKADGVCNNRLQWLCTVKDARRGELNRAGGKWDRKKSATSQGTPTRD